MFDAKLRPLIDPPLNAVGKRLARLGVSANMLTFAGLVLGLGGAAAIALDEIGLGFALIIANRLLDGLDGEKAETILDVPNDFFYDMGLEEVVTRQRLNGMGAILARIKKQVADSLR